MGYRMVRHKNKICEMSRFFSPSGGLLSYSMPQGSKRGENWEFYDQTYDGVWDGSQLRDGLGQLTDGRVGPTNFKDDFYGPERGSLGEGKMKKRMKSL